MSVQKNILNPQLNLYQLASRLKKDKQLLEAKRIFKNLIKKTTDINLTSGAFFHLGEIAYNEGNKKEAKQYFLKCLFLNFGHKKAKRYLHAISLSNLERNMLGNIEKLYMPPGHFYSPIPENKEIEDDSARIFGDASMDILAVDLNQKGQKNLLSKLKRYYQELPFKNKKQKQYRYYFENSFYSYSDAVFLYSMLRYLTPKRIIELGCGYSSCLILDANEKFLSNKIKCTFIDPYPDNFYSLINGRDKEENEILVQRVQDVPVEKFLTLQKRDILFVDTSHVVKTGSDVNHIFFEVLPRLRAGVYIHFHDIFYPFEYPREWICEGRAWNENYLLRAFLQYNQNFKIVLFNSFLERVYRDWFIQEMPLCLKNTYTYGGSIWLKKIN